MRVIPETLATLPRNSLHHVTAVGSASPETQSMTEDFAAKRLNAQRQDVILFKEAIGSCVAEGVAS